MIDLIRTMTQQADVPLCDAVRMASLTPATILGINDNFGSIQPNKIADLVVFDDRFSVQRVWIGAKLVFDQVDLAEAVRKIGDGTV
jgi:N-acetylglucosamine-6-phosphate deacetylase